MLISSAGHPGNKNLKIGKAAEGGGTGGGGGGGVLSLTGK